MEEARRFQARTEVARQILTDTEGSCQFKAETQRARRRQAAAFNAAAGGETRSNSPDV